MGTREETSVRAQGEALSETQSDTPASERHCHGPPNSPKKHKKTLRSKLREMKLKGKELQERVKKVPGAAGGLVGIQTYKRHSRKLKVARARL